MIPPSRRSWTARAIALALALLCTTPAPAQDEAGQQEMPDVAAMEAELEHTWASALAMGDEVEPIWKLQAMGTLLMQQFMLDRVRAIAAGVAEADLPPHTASREQVVARWRRERPNDPLGEIALTLDIQQPEERLAATLPLLDRFPDDPVLLEVSLYLLHQTGQVERAEELLEGHLERHPERSTAWRQLASHYSRIGNETRRAELVTRWAQRDPPHPEAVTQWLALPAAQQDPATTAALVKRFLASGPQGIAGLQTCQEIARRDPAVREEARACVARIAAGGDGSPAAQAAAEHAANALLTFATQDGDWQGLLAALDRLPPAARRRALRSAVHSVPAPDGCDTRVQLLRLVAETASEEEAGEDTAASTASALRDCAALPAARAIFVELLRTAPQPSGLIYAWVTRVQGRGWVGELPAETAAILEARLATAAAAEAPAVLSALDVAYQVAGDLSAHLELLQRWERRFPEWFLGDQALALAQYLLMDDRGAEAVALLERQVARPGWHGRVAEELWELYQERGGPERAERLVADLLASDDESRKSTGHLLAGRAAARAGDVAAAERHYMATLATFASPDVAGELVRFVASADAARAPAAARRACEETPLSDGGGVDACATKLLGEAGLPQAAAALLAEGSGQAPDLRALRDLAWKAQGVEDWQLAERIRRQIVELDPKSPDDRVHLAVLLEKRGKLAEIETLLAEARRDFQQAPLDLLRAAGRAHVAAGQARRGIELLREARAAMPATHEPGYVDAELREAYVALVREARPVREPRQAAADGLEERRRSAEAGDAEAAIDFAEGTMSKDAPAASCAPALALLERAASAGDPQAARRLGHVLFFGLGSCVAAEPGRGLEWLRKAAASNDRDAQYALGLALLMDEVAGAGRSAAEGIGLLERAAATRPGHPPSAEVLSLVYASGLGAPRDVQKARAFTAEAARVGSDGLPLLAWQASVVPAVEVLLARAAARLEPLAAAGDAHAAGLLGRMVDNGWGVPHDRERALRLIRSGAEGGDGVAMRQLAWAYEHGEGVPKDGAEAVRWWRRGAEAGDSFCMMFLSHALREGRLVRADPAAALSWLERSAHAGNSWAVASLGRWYDEGWAGTPRDERKAAEWKRRRAALGDEEARGWLAYHGLAAEP